MPDEDAPLRRNQQHLRAARGRVDGGGDAGGAPYGTYAERRIHVTTLAKPAREALEAALEGVQVADPGGS